MARNRTPELIREARRVVADALRTGLLTRATCCSQCGASRAVIHGHHVDYAFPLVVEWLCAHCHSRRHATDNKESPRTRVRCVKCRLLIYLHIQDAGLVEVVNGGLAHLRCRSDESFAESA